MFSEKKWCWRFWPLSEAEYQFIPEYLQIQERKRDGDGFTPVGGEALYVVKDEEMAEGFWIWMDEVIRTFDRQIIERNGDPKKAAETPLLKREIFSKEELQALGYAEYDRGYYYPTWQRLMLMKGKTIFLTHHPESETTQEKPGSAELLLNF